MDRLSLETRTGLIIVNRGIPSVQRYFKDNLKEHVMQFIPSMGNNVSLTQPHFARAVQTILIRRKHYCFARAVWIGIPANNCGALWETLSNTQKPLDALSQLRIGDRCCEVLKRLINDFFRNLLISHFWSFPKINKIK